MPASDVTRFDEPEIVFDSDAVQVDGAAINRQMNLAIANATTVDDILNANVTAVEKLRDVWASGDAWIRNPVTILSVAFNESNDEFAEGGWGFYSVMEVSDTDGVVHTLSTGAKSVVLKLYQINKHSSFPMSVPVQFTGTKTKAGYTVFDMVKAEA